MSHFRLIHVANVKAYHGPVTKSGTNEYKIDIILYMFIEPKVKKNYQINNEKLDEISERKVQSDGCE